MYDFFLACNTQLGISFADFKTSSGRIAELKSKVCKLSKLYLAYPCNRKSLDHHVKFNTSNESKETTATKLVTRFWSSHYKVDGQTGDSHVPLAEALELFHTCHKEMKLEKDEFTDLSPAALRDRLILKEDELCFWGSPLSRRARQAQKRSRNTESGPINNNDLLGDNVTPLKNISRFWNEHYTVGNAHGTISANEAYNHFALSKDFKGELLHQFNQSSRQVTGLKSVYNSKGAEKVYFAECKSEESTEHHDRYLKTIAEKTVISEQIETGEDRPMSTGSEFKVDLYVVNMRGLITKDNNKCDSLRALTNSGTKSQMIAITETWANGHYDAEFTRSFKGYDIKRSDRIIDLDPSDEYHLTSHGGVMLLSSPDLPLTEKMKFSNGNCEVLICEVPTINAVAITLYRPSGENFSLQKFKEAIKVVNDYLKYSDIEAETKHVIFMGDFNFPDRIVKWDKTMTGFGLTADYSEGESQEKKAFELLLNLSEDFDLDQIVDKPTHKENTLDLAFTNYPSRFSDCTVQDLGMISDHNLVHFQFEAALKSDQVEIESGTENKECKMDEFSQYDYGGGNVEATKKEFKKIRWDEILRPEFSDTLSVKFKEQLAKAMQRAQVPKWRKPRKDRSLNSKKVEELIKQRNVYYQKLYTQTL